MPRELCFGNGDLMITLDADLAIRDLYFPFVGMENHVGGHRCRFGAWVDGRFAWVDGGWDRSISYRPDSLVSEAVLTPPALPFELTVNDTVHPLYPVFLRRVVARDHRPLPPGGGRGDPLPEGSVRPRRGARRRSSA